jgi:hypothetical protein
MKMSATSFRINFASTWTPTNPASCELKPMLSRTHGASNSRHRSCRHNLLPVQLDQYAEACAELGMFRAAYLAHSDPAHREMYLAFNTALELEDAIWCEHGRAHAYPEKDVWSYVHAREITVMKCALCKFRNAKDIPDHAIEARAKRAEVRQAFSGLTPLEAKARMEKDPRFAHLVRKQ